MFLYVEPKITKFYNIVKRHDSWIADIQINFVVRRDCIIETGRGSLALNRVRMRFARTAQAVQQAPVAFAVRSNETISAGKRPQLCLTQNLVNFCQNTRETYRVNVACSAQFFLLFELILLHV